MHKIPVVLLALFFSICANATEASASASPSDDPYLWLEEVQSERALTWARERNAETKCTLNRFRCSPERRSGY